MSQYKQININNYSAFPFMLDTKGQSSAIYMIMFWNETVGKAHVYSNRVSALLCTLPHSAVIETRYTVLVTPLLFLVKMSCSVILILID